MISKATEQALVLGLGVLLALVLILWPEIDIATSRLFYLGEGRWQYSNADPLPGIAYRWTVWLGRLLIAVLLLSLLFGKWIPRFRPRWRQTSLFLLVAALLGPGLIVDQGLKGQLGRARPAQVEAFGGPGQFTPAFVPSNQCDRNCSFVSGHVASAAFVMAFGWLGTRRQRLGWLAASLLTAGYVGWSRIAVGGHFLSDVLFAWFFVYLALWACEKLFTRFGWPPESKDTQTD